MMRLRHLALALLLTAAGCASPQGAAPTVAGMVPAPRACPDWSRSSREDFSNRPTSNFGCADAVNFHAQLADPQDAVRGRGGGASDGAAAVAAIERMHERPANSAPAGASSTTDASKPGPES